MGITGSGPHIVRVYSARMTDPIPPCTRRRTAYVVWNGRTVSTPLNSLCLEPGCLFVPESIRRPVPEATRDLIRRLLWGRMSLSGSPGRPACLGPGSSGSSTPYRG